MKTRNRRGCRSCLIPAVGLFLLLAIVGGIVSVVDHPERKTQVTQKKETAKKRDVLGAASEELQAGRLDVIADLQREGVIQKIETPGTLPRVYVLPRFYTLTFDEKRLFMGVCYAYAYRLPQGDLGGFDKPMPIYDAMTNKSVGSFSARWGLSLD